tara:strand:+ start:1312 stop:1488 length:177 start_codon:yes stop_codon:yes gene_type:complete
LYYFVSNYKKVKNQVGYKKEKQQLCNKRIFLKDKFRNLYYVLKNTHQYTTNHNLQILK